MSEGPQGTRGTFRDRECTPPRPCTSINAFLPLRLMDLADWPPCCGSGSSPPSTAAATAWSAGSSFSASVLTSPGGWSSQPSSGAGHGLLPNVDLAGHRGGDEGGAEFLEAIDRVADLGDEGVDARGFAVEERGDGALFRIWRCAHSLWFSRPPVIRGCAFWLAERRPRKTLWCQTAARHDWSAAAPCRAQRFAGQSPITAQLEGRDSLIVDCDKTLAAVAERFSGASGLTPSWL